MPPRKTTLPVFGALLAIGMTAAAPSVWAICSGPGGVLAFEVEVRSCEAPREALKAAFEAQKAARPSYDPPLDFSQTEEQREAAKARAERLHQGWERDFADRSKRLYATPALILEVKRLRQKHFAEDPRRDPAANAEWEPSSAHPDERMLLRLKGSTQCSDLVGKKVVVLSIPECCDLVPPQNLACTLKLLQVELAPDLASE